MNERELKRLFPQSSHAFISANIDKDSRPNDPVECSPRDGALAKSKDEVRPPSKVLVRVTSVRKRLADEDGLCEKYLVDLCRYAGIIRGDDPSQAKIETSQRKVEEGEEEFTQIDIIPILGTQIIGNTHETLYITKTPPII